jgi:phytanoyl-CoA hydroxylase
MDQTLQQHYERKGYVMLDNIFTEEQVQLLKKEIKRILEQGEDMQCRVEVDQKKLIKQGVFIGLARISSMFREVVHDIKIKDVLKQLLGNPVNFTDDKIVFKDAEKDFGSPWHQDWQYWKGSHKVSVWIALDKATPENGCLKVVPGSHKKRIDHKELTGDGFTKWVLPDNIKDSEVEALPVEPGSAIILHDLLLHASYPNKSGHDRWAFIPTYTDVDWNLSKLFKS